MKYYEELNDKTKLSAEWREGKDYLSLTKERMVKLGNFLASESFVGLDEHQQVLAKMQYAAMDALANDLGTYVKILERRLE